VAESSEQRSERDLPALPRERKFRWFPHFAGSGERRPRLPQEKQDRTQDVIALTKEAYEQALRDSKGGEVSFSLELEESETIQPKGTLSVPIPHIGTAIGASGELVKSSKRSLRAHFALKSKDSGDQKSELIEAEYTNTDPPEPPSSTTNDDLHRNDHADGAGDHARNR